MLFLKSLMVDLSGVAAMGTCLIMASLTLLAFTAFMDTITSKHTHRIDQISMAVVLLVIIAWGVYMSKVLWDIGHWLLTN